MRFLNQADFDNPASNLAARGVDLRAANAIVDPKGNVLAYAQTGGMFGLARFELLPGVKLFRFGTAKVGAAGVATGSWWLEEREFGKLLRFSEIWGIAIGMALRTLCLVPPEWSDVTLLVSARVRDPLLAWRGLANSVVTANATMPHQNEIAERRVYQLFVPGLRSIGRQAEAGRGLQIEREFALDAGESLRGFLYLPASMVPA